MDTIISIENQKLYYVIFKNINGKVFTFLKQQVAQSLGVKNSKIHHSFSSIFNEHAHQIFDQYFDASKPLLEQINNIYFDRVIVEKFIDLFKKYDRNFDAENIN